MKAIVIKEFGDSSKLVQVDMPVPDIEPHEVLIEVKGSSVNPVDWKIREGWVPDFCPAFPAVLHPDCSGIIARVGKNVKDYEIGDEVYSFASGLMGKQGALAEYMPADARMVAKAPKTIPLADAATLPLVAMTAWTALIDRIQIQSGQSILIHGGTGGVGSIALQLAKIKFGDNIFATCGTKEKCRLAEELGAQASFNYNEMDGKDIFASAPNGNGFDVIFNTAGEVAINSSVLAAKYQGAILDINGSFPTAGPFQFKALSFTSIFGGYAITHGFGETRVGEVLSELTEYIDTGKIRPMIDPQRFGFNESGAAHDFLQHKSPIGKVAMTPAWDT